MKAVVVLLCFVASVFLTQAQRDPVCELPAVTGSCRGHFPRYFFNTATNTCESFIYGGCHGNQNKFRTLQACQAKCSSSASVCELPRETGPCRAGFRRFFFNSQTGRCERFTYGGCRGNANNFHTVEECRNACPGSGTVTCR